MKNFLAGLVIAVFLVGITNFTHASPFTDSFDDPNFTNSHWLDGNTLVPPTWSFVTLNGTDRWYHSTVDPSITNESAVKIADNGKEYCSAGLYIEAILRIDLHPKALFTTENRVYVSFYGTDNSEYRAGIQQDFVGEGLKGLFLSVVRPGQPERYLDNTPGKTLDFDTFYKLVVQIDSDQTIFVSLYNDSGQNIGNVSSLEKLSSEKGRVAIAGKYASTYNNFFLDSSETDADNDCIDNAIDNCPCIKNIDQTDSNNDGIGDACTAHYYSNDFDQDCDVDGQDVSLFSFETDTLDSFSPQYGSVGAP